MDDIVASYAENNDVDPSVIMDRWSGRPDLLIEDIFRVRDPETREVVDLELFSYQRKMVHAYFYGDSPIITVFKGRRIGCTFVFLLCMAVDGLRYPKTVYPILAQSGTDAKKRIDDLDDIFEMSRLGINIEDDGGKSIATQIVLPNGSRYEAFTAGANTGRGDDPARAVMMDEMAFYPEQEETIAAFGASTALGENQKEIRISTPLTLGDKFMESYNNGTETGYVDDSGNAVNKDHPEATPTDISMKQPSVRNPDDIDIKKSLFEQDVTPVRPDLNLRKLESDRKSDPMKFATEYLCRPMSDEYRFFSQKPVERAIQRSNDPNYRSGINWKPSNPKNRVVVAVDVAFGGGDDTAISVWEHVYGRKSRNMRYFELLRREQLEDCPKIREEPVLGNPEHQAKRIVQIAENTRADHIIYDATNAKFFKETLRKYTGKGLIDFNFSDTEAVIEMAEGLNHGLHNDDVTLLDNANNDMKKQLLSVVKQQKEDFNRPKLTGKEKSPTGTDDAAMSAILGAYPSMLSDNAGGKELREVEKDEPTSQRGTNNPRKLFGSVSGQNFGGDEQVVPSYGSTNVSRGRKYLSRYRN